MIFFSCLTILLPLLNRFWELQASVPSTKRQGRYLAAISTGRWAANNVRQFKHCTLTPKQVSATANMTTLLWRKNCSVCFSYCLEVLFVGQQKHNNKAVSDMSEAFFSFSLNKLKWRNKKKKNLIKTKAESKFWVCSKQKARTLY